MEDCQIIEQFWSRNENAIIETGNKYGRLLNSIAYNILSNKEDSEECVNDAYRKAWDSIPPQRPCSLAAYLGRIVRNLAINRWYENHAQKRYNSAQILLCELSDCLPASTNVESEVELNELSEIINSWLYSLPKDDRVLFLRRYWYGDSVKKLAYECRTTPGRVAGRMFRLRHNLKIVLEKEGVSI